MVGSKKQNHAPVYVPHELIENILPRLPVKSLLRFKSVSKRWNAIISAPKFRQTHLRQSHNSSSLLLHQLHTSAQIVRFENDEIRALSAVDYPPAHCAARSRALCHCDGLLLIPGEFGGPANNFCLWNPSSGAHRKLRYPFSEFIDKSKRLFGICFDPSVQNYKVVIGDPNRPNRLAVFRCETSSWRMIRITLTNGSDYIYNPSARFRDGVSFKGSVYWLVFLVDEQRCEIARFDGRDEELKSPWKQVDSARATNGYLISSEEALYLFPFYNVEYQNQREDDQIVVMKRFGGDDDEPWMEFRVQLPLSFRSIVPLCWTRRDQILFRVCWDNKHLLYDHAKGSFALVENTLDLRFSALIPYVENMYFL